MLLNQSPASPASAQCILLVGKQSTTSTTYLVVSEPEPPKTARSPQPTHGSFPEMTTEHGTRATLYPFVSCCHCAVNIGHSWCLDGPSVRAPRLPLPSATKGLSAQGHISFHHITLAASIRGRKLFFAKDSSQPASRVGDGVAMCVLHNTSYPPRYLTM